MRFRTTRNSGEVVVCSFRLTQSLRPESRGLFFVRAGFATFSFFGCARPFRETVVHSRIKFGNAFVEFSNDGFCVASIGVPDGVATLALIPLVQEARRADEIGAAAAVPFPARRPHLLRHRHDRLKSAAASSRRVNRLARA
jgi:hypothetical protein